MEKVKVHFYLKEQEEKRSGVVPITEYITANNLGTLFAFMQEVIKQLKRLNKVRTSETYSATLNSFMRFRNGKDILLSEMNIDLVMGYEAYLRSEGVTWNTISFYMRILRAVYNRAVEKELIIPKLLFKRVYTGIDKTVKRAISAKSIKQIKYLDLPLYSSLDFARDMFLFSFYTRGMSFVDMAYLRKSDMKNGILSYRRRKTGQLLSIRWEKCMQEIVDKYPDNEKGYLLSIIIKKNKSDRSQYKSALHLINNKLKEIARLADVPNCLTMYVARHSWASIAKHNNIPIGVISESMGHESENTTQIYLASLDATLIDKANELILKNI